jgi:restriction system protein
MARHSPAGDFPYVAPAFLSPVLRILADGEEHSTEEIRSRILAEFPLTAEQLLLRRRVGLPTVFVNKVAYAFARLVLFKAIVAGEATPETYRITDHGREVLKRHPNDARERDL